MLISSPCLEEYYTTGTSLSKKRTESHLTIDPGGLGYMRMSTEQFRTVGSVNFKKRKGPNGPDDGHYPLQLVHHNFAPLEKTTNLNESPKVKHILVIVSW